jgi:hypothetical protein
MDRFGPVSQFGKCLAPELDKNKWENARMTGNSINQLPNQSDEKPGKTESMPDAAQGFSLYSFLKDDGSLDYQEYKRIQTEDNKRTIDYVWVREDNIAFLSDYIKETIGDPQFGICHGTRAGKEQEWFRKFLNCDVIGTEISETAENFPDTIQWDFHDIKPEWLNAADFIYSNSFDHSYDPENCLDTWMSCVKKNGLCILEHSSHHATADASAEDPFKADIVQMPYLILTWGQGKYGVREILTALSKSEKLEFLCFIVIQKF